MRQESINFGSNNNDFLTGCFAAEADHLTQLHNRLVSHKNQPQDKLS